MIGTFHIGLRYTNKRFGKKAVLDSTAIDLRSHDCVVITGRNGAAKITPLRLVSGPEKPDRGEVVTDDAIAWPWWRQHRRLLESIRQSRQR